MKVIDQALLEKVIRQPCHSHKGDYGRLLLLGGPYPYGELSSCQPLQLSKWGRVGDCWLDKEEHSGSAQSFYLRLWLFLKDQQLFKSSWKKAVVLLGRVCRGCIWRRTCKT